MALAALVEVAQHHPYPARLYLMLAVVVVGLTLDQERIQVVLAAVEMEKVMYLE